MPRQLKNPRSNFDLLDIVIMPLENGGDVYERFDGTHVYRRNGQGHWRMFDNCGWWYPAYARLTAGEVNELYSRDQTPVNMTALRDR